MRCAFAGLLLAACSSGPLTGGPDAAAARPCADHADAVACMEAGCPWVVPVVVDNALACNQAAAPGLCAERADHVGYTRAAFFRPQGAGFQFHSIGCPGDQNSRSGMAPAGFTACTGAQDEPEGCACFCRGGSCWGERQLAAMTTCGLPLPCDAYDANRGVPGYDAAATCILEHLASRGAAQLSTHGNYGDPVIHNATFLLGAGATALHAQRRSDTACPNCCDRFDPALAECELKPPAWFQACLEATDAAAQRDCMLPDNWFVSCVPAAPRCA